MDYLFGPAPPDGYAHDLGVLDWFPFGSPTPLGPTPCAPADCKHCGVGFVGRRVAVRQCASAAVKLPCGRDHIPADFRGLR